MAKRMVFTPPTESELLNQAESFYKQSKKKEYRAMLKDGSLGEICKTKAEAAARSAAALIQSGVPEGPAWDRAVRQEILEDYTD